MIEDDLTLEELRNGLYFSYACRALLGGGKGTFIMLQLYEQSPEHYRLTMDAAKKELLKTHSGLREAIAERYRQLQMVAGDLMRERSN
uniref:Uncharacterized protein n=1 Tax=viral metagenome TaxID=1070528 RepID=A0A6M3IEF6_9ZZZZ